MGRLVFLDVDGTLIDHSQRMPLSAQNACRAATAAGHTLVLCTGRSLPEIYPQVWEVGFGGIVSANGAYVRLGDDVLADERMSAEQVRLATEVLTSYGAVYAWQNPDVIYTEIAFIESLGDVAGENGSDWAPYLDLLRPVMRSGLPDSSSKCTFTLLADTGSTLADIVNALGPSFSVVAGSLQGVRGTSGEIVAQGVSKGTGLRLVAEHYGVDMAHTVAVGDSANDVPMLRAAGLGIAMGNATAAAKAEADWVSAPLADDGLAKALVYAGLLGD